MTLLVCGCGAPRQEPAVPAPAVALTSAGVDGADESDSVYNRMAIAAASRIRMIADGKSVGMYPSKSSNRTLRGLVTAVIQEYDFIVVKPGESKIFCPGRQSRAARTMGPAMPQCRIDSADILVQLNSVQMTRDSGYVGGLLSEVPIGSERMRTKAFCLVAARHGADWIGVRNTDVDAPRDCANDRKH